MFFPKSNKWIKSIVLYKVMKPYPEALEFLYGLTQSGIKLGLRNTSRLLAHFGDPQLKPHTIHIAGTNGKGSTAAFTESILRAAGYRVGLYTSPHLSDFRERIQVNRQLITEEELLELVQRIRQAADRLNVPLTFFEFGTVMAFLYFFDQKTDINVIEVGLGGRLDATNLCQAEISVITSIGQDHTQYLGLDPLAIAWEKASIIKEGGMVFAHIIENAVFDVVREVAGRCSARVFRLGKDFHVTLKSQNPGGQTMGFSWGPHRFDDIDLPLIGKHQGANAALAVGACLGLASKGMGLPESAVRQGLETTRWEGRLEVVSHHPTIILDCAHNPEGVKSLTKTVRETFSYSRCLLILGIMMDKPVEEMLALFAGFGDHILLVQPKGERSANPEILRSRLLRYRKPVEIIDKVPNALQTAKKIAKPDDIICITGSIFTVSEARQTLRNEQSVVPDSDYWSDLRLNP